MAVYFYILALDESEDKEEQQRIGDAVYHDTEVDTESHDISEHTCENDCDTDYYGELQLFVIGVKLDECEADKS